jgi:hypothetical protein
MNRIQPRNTSAETATYGQLAVKDASRTDKANNFLTEVLPIALNLGLNLKGADSKTTRKDTKETQVKSSGAAGAAGTAGAAGVLGEMAGLGTMTSWASIAGGIMGAADIALHWGRSTPTRGAASGSAVGAMVGTMICPGIGTAIGAAVGAIGGGLLGCIKSGKHKDQKVRDEVRTFLMEKGVIDSNYSIGLADGSRFNIGYDGGPKKELNGRRPFETDMSNPLTKYAISWLNPIVAFMSQGNQKVHTDFVGYCANAAISNAKSLDDVKANVNAIMKQFDLNNDRLVQGIVKAAEAGQIDTESAKAWLNGIRERTTPAFKGDLAPKARRTASKEEPEEIKEDDEASEEFAVN